MPFTSVTMLSLTLHDTGINLNAVEHVPNSMSPRVNHRFTLILVWNNENSHPKTEKLYVWTTASAVLAFNSYSSLHLKPVQRSSTKAETYESSLGRQVFFLVLRLILWEEYILDYRPAGWCLLAWSKCGFVPEWINKNLIYILKLYKMVSVQVGVIHLDVLLVVLQTLTCDNLSLHSIF